MSVLSSKNVNSLTIVLVQWRGLARSRSIHARVVPDKDAMGTSRPHAWVQIRLTALIATSNAVRRIPSLWEFSLVLVLLQGISGQISNGREVTYH